MISVLRSTLLMSLGLPETPHVLGKSHLCSGPEWEAPCGPSNVHSPVPRNAPRVSLGSLAHGPHLPGGSGLVSCLRPSPWLLAAIDQRLHVLGTCRMPRAVCLPREDKVHKHPRRVPWARSCGAQGPHHDQTTRAPVPAELATCRSKNQGTDIWRQTEALGMCVGGRGTSGKASCRRCQ